MGWATVNSVCQNREGGYFLVGSTGALPVAFGHREQYIWLVKLSQESEILPTPFPMDWLSFVVVAVILVVILGLGLLVYLKKRRKPQSD